MKLVLVRHGESEANEQKVYAGQSDAKLTQKGRDQALQIRPVLQEIPFDKVYSSDLSRAMDTQKLALPGYEAQISPLLREYDVGSLVGQPFSAMLKAKDPRSFVEFGGENRDMVKARAEKFLAQLEQDPHDYVAAFSHNGFMRAVINLVLGFQPAEGCMLNGNCAIHVLNFDGTRWSLLAWNYGKKI